MARIYSESVGETIRTDNDPWAILGSKHSIYRFISASSLERILELLHERGMVKFAHSEGVIFALEVDLSADEIRQAFKNNSCAEIRICYDLGNARSQDRCPEEDRVQTA